MNFNLGQINKPNHKPFYKLDFKTYKNKKVSGVAYLAVPPALCHRHSIKFYSKLVRYLLAAGFSIENDFIAYGETPEDLKLCRKVYKILCKIERSLMVTDFPNGIPDQLPETKEHFKLRKSDKTAILIQRNDGTWPEKSEKYGASGYFRIGEINTTNAVAIDDLIS